MSLKLSVLTLAAALLWPAVTQAERVRYHFVPAAQQGTLVFQPLPSGAAGERIRPFGTPIEPFAYQLRPTHIVTFRHSYTGCNVNVPLRLPDSTPRMEHATDRVTFNYGSYTIAVSFLADGSVDVTYDSGPFRPL